MKVRKLSNIVDPKLSNIVDPKLSLRSPSDIISSDSELYPFSLEESFPISKEINLEDLIPKSKFNTNRDINISIQTYENFPQKPKIATIPPIRLYLKNSSISEISNTVEKQMHELYIHLSGIDNDYELSEEGTVEFLNELDKPNPKAKMIMTKLLEEYSKEELNKILNSNG